MQFNYKKTTPIPSGKIQDLLRALNPYRQEMIGVNKAGGYTENEGTINLPFDKTIAKTALALAKKFKTKKLKYIVVVGIGGSNLGTKAIYDALYGCFDLIEPSRMPKMIFLDTCDPEFLARFKKFLVKEIKNPNEVVINIISKSGGTTETIANVEFIGAKYKKRTVITTAINSPLWQKAEKLKIETLPIPQKVGGRYSVLSTVGLFPLALVGINIEKLLDGARRAVRQGLKPGTINPSAMSAIMLFANYRRDKIINDNFIFHSELESLGKWYRQLMGESIGKEKNLNDRKVNAGITPTVSIGSIDLHSVGQLYLGGPKDKMTTFITTKKFEDGASVPAKRFLPEVVEMINKKSAGDVMSAIYQGVKSAYQKQKLPYIEVLLDDISEKSLGEFMQFKMMEMMYLARLMNINAFDQKNVELYKEETKKNLK